MTKLGKPRVAILHYAAPPTIGGVEFTLAKHARLYADHEYPVKIIAGRGEAFDARVPVEIIAEVDSRSPRVLQVNAELAQGAVSETFSALTHDLTNPLERALADCDVLIVHNALSLHKNLALTAALHRADTAQIKIVAWCHDLAWSDPQYASEVHPGFPWELLKRPWQGVQYVVVSPARQKELQQLWGARTPDIAVVPPGIDPCEFFGVTQETERWMRDLALRDAAPLLLLPARLTRRKNIEQAIEIVAALRGLGLNAKLVVTGPPGAHNPTNAAYLEELSARRQLRRVNDAVIFLHEFGEVSETAMRDWYLLADALLFPSEREGFGIPLLEAALARLPIFCADLPAFHETARTHVRYFTRDEAPNAIAARIADYLANDSVYQFKQRVRREFSWERIFAECLEPLAQDA